MNDDLRPLHATLTFDGGSRGNPGPSGYGFVLSIVDEEPILVGDSIPDTTNNVAEYSGLIQGIKRALAEGVTHLEILGDSKLVICQLNGEWQCRKEHLKPLLSQAWNLLAPLEWTATHMRRKHNSAADLLANQAMDRAAPFTIASPISL